MKAAMKRRDFVAGTLAIVVPGCAVGPEFTTPEMKIADQFDGKNPSQSVTVTDAKWWSAFQDPVLDSIVEIGLSQNLDIRRAVARIKSAEGVSAAAGYPISGSARVGEGKFSDTSEAGDSVATGFARAEASWRLDLFGKLENEREVGRTNLDAAYEDADIWRLTLISDVISAYIDLRYAQELIRITKRINESRRQTLKAAEKLFAEGKAGEIDVAQAKALLATSRASMPDLRVLFVIFLNRIMALLGVTELNNKAEFDELAPQPLIRSTVVKTGVPADLIRNRPDIRRAERRLASALATVGVAEADLYPSFVLTGNIALNLSSSSSTINAGFLRVGFDLPIFDRPVRKGRVKASLGVAEERRAEWEKEVILAVEEVRNNIYALRQHERAVQQATKALEATRDVLEIARREFLAGNLDFFLVQDAERAFLSSERALAQDRRNVAIDWVSLNIALGGTYRPAGG